MHPLKQQLVDHCRAYLDGRIRASREAIQFAQSAANEETKSSSGDKYETGRAMMQIEIEQNNALLSETLRLKDVFDKIPFERTAQRIQPGRIAITDQANFFIAISVGKVLIDASTYFIVSAESPIAMKMAALTEGMSFSFGNKQYRIRQIL